MFQAQKNINNDRLISIIFLCVSTFLLSLAFFSNPWSSVQQKWFIEWRNVKDAPVVGRLTQSRMTGLLSYAGLLGYGDASSIFNDSDLVRHQYETYQSLGEFQEFTTYNSAIGFQGLLFGLFEKYSVFPPAKNWRIFQVSTSVLSGLALSLVSLWLFKEFGLTAAVFSVGFMLISEWLILFGGSVYWSIWALYLPLIISAYLFGRSICKGYISRKEIFFLVYLSILIKCLFNGFEYITVVLIMSYIPLVYYGIVNNWNKETVTKTIASTLFAQVIAVFTALLILLYQNTVVLGGIKNAIDNITFALEKRSIGNPINFSGPISESLSADLITVIKSYITGRSILIDIKELTLPMIGEQLNFNLEIQYIYIFATFLLFTLFFVAFRKKVNWINQQRKIQSLIIVTWLSLLAPLSWFSLFKAHSYLHLHLNFIIWQMPFTILGFGMCGTIVQAFMESRLHRNQFS